jgi:hypothetical protein
MNKKITFERKALDEDFMRDTYQTKPTTFKSNKPNIERNNQPEVVHTHHESVQKELRFHRPVNDTSYKLRDTVPTDVRRDAFEGDPNLDSLSFQRPASETNNNQARKTSKRDQSGLLKIKYT